MKLALINLCTVRDIKPPLGLVSIATYLEKYLGFKDTVIIDPNFQEPITELKRIKPDLIGISSMTNEYSAAIRLARNIKKIMNVPLIIGGVHISTLPLSLDEVFDLGIVGEGEQTFLELIKLFQEEGKFELGKIKKINGLVYHDGNSRKLTPLRELIDPIDKIPFLDRKYISKKYFEPHYTMSLARLVREATLLTSRGCPYNCAFCSTSHFWKRVRFHSAQHVVDEIKDCVDKYNSYHFDVWDDLFTVNKQRLRDMIVLLKEKGLLSRVSFSCLVRANTLDDEMCQLLKELNVKALNFGFESGNDRIIKFLKGPSSSAEMNRNAIIKAKKYGFRIAGSLIFASPTETLEEMEDSVKFIDFAYKHGVNTLYSFIMIPFPGTKIWQIAKERGKVSDAMWDDIDEVDRRDPFNMLNEAKGWANPLLLDDSISKEDFIKLFLRGRKKLTKFRFRFIKDSLSADFIGTLRYALSHIDYTFNSVKGILRGNK